MKEFKKVNFEGQSVADKVKHLPEGYELWSTVFGKVNYRRVASDGCILCKNPTECFQPDGAFFEGCPCCLYPSEEVQSWKNFCAPAKDEIVFYKMNNSHIIHISGKWFENNSPSGGGLPIEVEPVYLADKYVDSWDFSQAHHFIDLIHEELNLTLNLDTLEWSEKASLITLSDGAKAEVGDTILVRDSSLERWEKYTLFGYNPYTSHKYLTAIAVRWLFAVPFNGHEHLEGSTKSWDAPKPEQPKMATLSDGHKVEYGSVVYGIEHTDKTKTVQEGTLYCARTKDNKTWYYINIEDEEKSPILCEHCVADSPEPPKREYSMGQEVLYLCCEMAWMFSTYSGTYKGSAEDCVPHFVEDNYRGDEEVIPLAPSTKKYWNTTDEPTQEDIDNAWEWVFEQRKEGKDE